MTQFILLEDSLGIALVDWLVLEHVDIELRNIDVVLLRGLAL